MWPGQQKWTKLAQNTPNHKTLNIFGSVCTINFLLVKCSLSDCLLLLIEISCWWVDQIIGYDVTKLKYAVKLYVPTWSIFTGPITYRLYGTRVFMVNKMLIMILCRPITYLYWLASLLICITSLFWLGFSKQVK